MTHPATIRSTYSNRGFTFVHVSTLFVIVGLILGGVTIAKIIIRNNHISTVVNELEEHRSTTINFQMKYDYLPGDIPIPAITWQTCTTEICIGNGNNFIEFPYESSRTWQQLVDTEFVSPFKSATTSTPHNTLSIGGNVLGAAINNAGYLFMDDAELHDDNKRSINALFLGSISPDKQHLNHPAVNASEAWSIDEKIDDTFPISGDIRAFNTEFLKEGDCFNTKKYRSVSDKKTCGLYYIINIVR